MTLGEWSLKASSPERAILEAIDELPNNEGFHAFDGMFQGLVSLRPRTLMALLESKVQVKRLFFVFADKHDHAWRNYLDASEVDLDPVTAPLPRGAACTRTTASLCPQSSSPRQRRMRMARERYMPQVQLVIRTLPLVAQASMKRSRESRDARNVNRA